MRYFHTALSVKSIEKSQKFYEVVFKLKFRTGAERKELGVRFINLEDEQGNVIELFEHNHPLPLNDNLMDFRKIGIKHIAFVVGNIEKVLDVALQNGASMIHQPKSGKTVKRYAFIADPDGIPIELAEL